MAKVKTQFICTNCGFTSARYLGRCSNCGEWGTFVEEKIQELQEQKKHLVSQVLDGTESRASLSLAEIREILGISEAST